MQSPSLAVRPLTDPKANSSENRSLTAHRPRDVQHRHMTRRVEIQALMPNGDVRDFTGLAPARPVFDEAFTAFSRGTLFQTDNGLVAVEDLLPGDVIQTADRGLMTLIWKGCTTLAPSMHDASTGGPLTRIHAESYGVGRPMPDLLLGPAARVMQRTPDLAASIGTDKALTPAASLVDGMNAISVSPISPVRVYHLAFEKHVLLQANGMEIESFHPGTQVSQILYSHGLQLYMSFFPHISRLGDFGPLSYPRLTQDELERLRG